MVMAIILFMGGVSVPISTPLSRSRSPCAVTSGEARAGLHRRPVPRRAARVLFLYAVFGSIGQLGATFPGPGVCRLGRRC